MIPLYSVHNERLISLTGIESSFFKINPLDLEQMTMDLREQSYGCLENDLRLAEFGDFFKVYFLNGQTYLNSKTEVSLGDCGLVKSTTPIETFLGGELSSNIDFFDTYLTINGKFLRVLTLRKAPFELAPNELMDLCDGQYSYVLHLKRLEPQHSKKKLNLRRKLHFSGLFKSLKDIDSENAYSESEGLLEAVTKGETALFKMECFFLVSAQSLSELNDETQALVEKLKALEAKVIIEAKALPVIFTSLIPGVPPLFHRELEVPSDYLSYLVPYQKDRLMDRGLFLTSLTGHEIRFDLFEPSAHNYNLLITGSSGQGKSMMANKLLYELLKNGTKAMCLDLGNSFKKNALFHKGAVFSETFNPLQFRCPRYLKEFILACMDEPMSKREQGRLFEAVCDALIAEVATFDQLISYLAKEFHGISNYFSEIREFFDDQEACLESFTYCDFTNYPEAIKAPLIIYLIEYFKGLDGQKVFVFDECWHLLTKNADYIAECFRTFRKHQASAVAISQNLDDFSETQLGRVIIQNTYFKFFFRQSLSLGEFIEEDIAQRVSSLQSVKGQYSQFLIQAEGLRKSACYYPTALEYELFTSDRVDSNYFESYFEEKGRFLDFKQALINFTELKYPHWRFYESTY